MSQISFFLMASLFKGDMIHEIRKKLFSGFSGVTKCRSLTNKFRIFTKKIKFKNFYFFFAEIKGNYGSDSISRGKDRSISIFGGTYEAEYNHLKMLFQFNRGSI